MVPLQMVTTMRSEEIARKKTLELLLIEGKKMEGEKRVAGKKCRQLFGGIPL